MKKFLFVLGIVVITAGIFAGGMFAGVTFDVFKSMYTVSFFEEEASSASTTFMVVRMLDENKIDDAKGYLNLTLDTKIMAVGMLMPGCDNEKSKKMANNVLARIAKHRQEHPVPPRDKQVDDLTQSFLTKALIEVEKQNKGMNADQ